MVQYIPMLILMGVFAAIGMYWAVLTGHFLAWTRKYKDSFHKWVDNQLAQPPLKESYASLKSDRGSLVMTWGIRMIGVALAGTGVVTIGQLIVCGL